MRGNYIDFISAYCDRRCERCAFTDRCSHYAIERAIEMCDGDVEAGIELAVGAPPPMTDAERKRREEWLEGLSAYHPTDAELEEIGRLQEARDERVDQSALTTESTALLLLGRAWFAAHPDVLPMCTDMQVAEALEVARHDLYLIPPKVHRALHGLDEFQLGEISDADPVQNDWNGSAKVALVAMVRSIAAWDVIADATGDADARHIAGHLRALRTTVEQTFPQAWRFVRPGFDVRPPARASD